jgi:probable HAF family extracellular repeat protein
MSGNTTTHAFLWTKREAKCWIWSLFPGINGNPRAFLWKDGRMTDLNELVPANSPLHLLTAFGINDAGEIAGFGVTGSGDLHAFLATPCAH